METFSSFAPPPSSFELSVPGVSDVVGIEQMLMMERDRVQRKPHKKQNWSATHSYPLNPWADGSHEMLQPYHIGFVMRHLDAINRTHSILPLFRMNIELRERWMRWRTGPAMPGYEARPEEIRFRDLLEKLGEKVLEDYDFAKKNGLGWLGTGKADEQNVREFHRLATTTDFWPLTRFGILSYWNFLGVCHSKGESTGPGAYLDMHDHTSIVYVAGMTIAGGARCYNYWGRKSESRVGSSAKLILKRRARDAPYQWEPYACFDRDYPPIGMMDYQDPAGKPMKAHIQDCGFISHNMEKDPSEQQVFGAMGFTGSKDECLNAHGGMPCIRLQILI